MKFRFSLLYGTLTVILFVIEVFIALYVNDQFVRPYVGDFLVVVLLYCFVRTFIDAPVVPVAMAVLAFSYLVEALQYFDMVTVLGLRHSRLANVVLGNYFTWSDIIAYTLGIALTMAVELYRKPKQPKKGITSNAIPSFDSAQESAMRYDEFFGPMFFEPYAIEVAARIDPSSVSVALEIAAGTGRVTRHIRQRISASARLIASDISEDMLAVATKKLGDLTIDWQHIDAQQLPFSDNSIDLVVCSFGYMFVPDKPKAFAEAYRVLKPGGMFLFTTWDKLEHNGASYIARSTTKKYVEGPLPESYDLATSMHDETLIRPLLEDAGFSKFSIEKVQKNSVCTTAKEAAIGLVQSGPVFEDIKKRNPAWIDEIISTVEKELSEKFGVAPMIAPISAVISQAWK